MKIALEPLEKVDVAQVVQGWNASLPYDRVDNARFEEVILKDPNHEEGAALVAIADGKVVGFISSVARDGIEGADKRGREAEADHGYIKGFYVLEGFREQGIGTRLLDEALRYVQSKGKSIIRVITYTGRYFFPGVDLRYEPAIKFFEGKGFRRDHVIDDIELDLVNFQISAYQKDAMRRMTEFGVQVQDYEPQMLDKMREFVRKFNSTSWFPEGWEEKFKSKGNNVVALKGDKILGWAAYHPRKGTAGFGPIGVLVEDRGHGIGSCLLLESVLRLKAAGATKVFASWANTPFYLPNGWTICRQYVVFEKKLD